MIALGKQNLKLNNVRIPLTAAYANRETCQIPMCLLHKLSKQKIEYGIKFQFEYLILHLKSGLLKQIMKSILQ